MRGFTLGDLNQLIRSCLDAAEVVEVGPEHLDLEFDLLGVDSLGRYELAAQIEAERGIPLADAAVDCRTPGELLDLVKRTSRPVLAD